MINSEIKIYKNLVEVNVTDFNWNRPTEIPVIKFKVTKIFLAHFKLFHLA